MSAIRNPIREKLEAGKVSLGVWSDLMSDELVELCGSLGYDFFVLDAEHDAIGEADCAELVSACARCGLVSVVRVPSHHDAVLSGFLATGCQGIYVPHVSKGAEARRIVDVVRAAAEARRDTKPGEDPMIFALVEEQEGIANIEEISRTDGVDVIGIGRTDLSKSMGYEGNADHADLLETIRAAEGTIRAAGRAFDAVVRTREEAERAIAGGALIVSVSLRGVIRSGLAQVSARTVRV